MPETESLFFDNAREGREHRGSAPKKVRAEAVKGERRSCQSTGTGGMGTREGTLLQPRETVAGLSVAAFTKGKYGQARKGPWWMPWSYCTMKAVVSCEKPRGGAHIPRSAGSRMG